MDYCALFLDLDNSCFNLGTLGVDLRDLCWNVCRWCLNFRYLCLDFRDVCLDSHDLCLDLRSLNPYPNDVGHLERRQLAQMDGDFRNSRQISESRDRSFL